MFSKVLFLGAHTDDEFGCSGTLARLIEEGSEVYYVALSSCEESVPKGFPKDILRSESRAAAQCLGIKPENWHLLTYQVRHFPQHRQSILEHLVRLRNSLQPDLVLVPSPTDVHQDHQTVCREALRAFKFGTILGYELPMNTITFKHACFVPLQERHLAKKIASLACYQSQRFRSYTQESFIRSLAQVRGVQAGVRFAEAFEVVRWIWSDNGTTVSYR
ncbi:MAG: PIG-L deacetylase family protein [candidate division WOR-3 bacterium]